MRALIGRNWAAGILALALAAGAAAQARTSARRGGRAITVDDLLAIERVSDPQISPDGRWVAYVVSHADRQANRMTSNLWIVPAAGGEARQLTRGGSDARPRWAPTPRASPFSPTAPARARSISFRLPAERPGR